MNELKNYNKSIFESIKHIDEENNEYWSARELQHVLEYTGWEKFSIVIDNAKIACFNSNNIIEDHFHQVGKMVSIGSNVRKN